MREDGIAPSLNSNEETWRDSVESSWDLEPESDGLQEPTLIDARDTREIRRVY